MNRVDFLFFILASLVIYTLAVNAPFGKKQKVDEREKTTFLSSLPAEGANFIWFLIMVPFVLLMIMLWCEAVIAIIFRIFPNETFAGYISDFQTGLAEGYRSTGPVPN